MNEAAKIRNNSESDAEDIEDKHLGIKVCVLLCTDLEKPGNIPVKNYRGQ